MQNYEATIAAVSTAVSNAGIGIVRMSGPEAFGIADRVYKRRGLAARSLIRFIMDILWMENL